MPTRLRCLLALLLVLLPLSALAQSYSSVLVFGDSLSDTGNVAHLTQSQVNIRIPSPLAGYTDGRFTDGKDTTPAASLYTGVWIEQLVATFPQKPAVTASLDGGTNYAYGYAFTGTGTSALDLGLGVSVNVDNLGQQVSDYLAAHPTVPANTLVVVWAGANDVINATSTAMISAAATSELTAIQRLVTAGATDLLVVNLPPLGAIPRFNTTTNADMATAGAQAFNAGLASGLAALPAANSGVTLNLMALDAFTLFNNIISDPAASGITDTIGESQNKPTVNPDEYIFWDDLHPTTTVHHLLAVAAATLLAPPSPSISAVLAPTSVTVKAGSPATSTLTVTPAGGFNGSVSISCGSLPTNAACSTDSTPPRTFSTPQNFTITVTTNGSTPATPAALLPLGSSGAALLAAVVSLLGLARLRALSGSRRLRPGLLGAVAALSLASVLGLAGCGGDSHNTPPGTYNIPLTVTPSAGSATTATLTVVVQ